MLYAVYIYFAELAERDSSTYSEIIKYNTTVIRLYYISDSNNSTGTVDRKQYHFYGITAPRDYTKTHYFSRSSIVPPGRFDHADLRVPVKKTIAHVRSHLSPVGSTASFEAFKHTEDLKEPLVAPLGTWWMALRAMVSKPSRAQYSSSGAVLETDIEVRAHGHVVIKGLSGCFS